MMSFMVRCKNASSHICIHRILFKYTHTHTHTIGHTFMYKQRARKQQTHTRCDVHVLYTHYTYVYIVVSPGIKSSSPIVSIHQVFTHSYETFTRTFSTSHHQTTETFQVHSYTHRTYRHCQRQFYIHTTKHGAEMNEESFMRRCLILLCPCFREEALVRTWRGC